MTDTRELIELFKHRAGQWFFPGIDGNAIKVALERQQADIERLRVALTKIDAIRNDIIGRQRIGWSSHVYPLVEALGEAGFEGLEYEAAKAQAVSAQAEIEALRKDAERYRWLRNKANIDQRDRAPMVFNASGSEGSVQWLDALYGAWLDAAMDAAI